ITQTGWFGVGVAMFAIPVAAFYHLNVYLLVLIMGFLMTLTSVKGIKALSIFGIIAVPLITVLGFYSVYLSFHTSGSLQNMFSNHPLKPLSMAMALSIVIGNFISGGTSTPNFTRFSKNSIGAISATVIAFFVGNIFMFIFGATGAAAFGKADIFDTLIMQGLAIPAILSLGLNIWSTNNNALYASGISLANITNNSMKLMTMIAGTIGTLSLLSSLIPPIGSIIVVDYFMHRSNYKTEECQINYNLSALCPIFIGAFVGCVIKIGIPPINSLIAAIISYLLLQYIKINK
ncbi:MAG: cytosine permease, partial [Lactobacillus iners]|nr:cytosine permease [Lactobacillus iners]